MTVVREGGVSFSWNPQISVVAQGGYDRANMRRGVTRTKDLWRLGVNVFSSQDDVNDPSYPFGRNDQQEVAAHVCHACHMTYPDEIRAVFDFITANAAKALRLEGYGLERGCRADLNVLSAATVQHVLRLQQPPVWVIRNGKILARTEMTRRIEQPAP